MITIFIGVTFLLGFYMAWTIGANDVANSMADAVGSDSCTIKQAVIAAGICEFAGAVLVGAHVTDTIRKGIVDPSYITSIPGMTQSHAAAIIVIGMVSALLAAAIWLHVATAFGMPVSTTHSIVGGVTGFGIIAAGWAAVNWSKIGQIVASWFISPLLGGILSFIIFKIISGLILQHNIPTRRAVRYAPLLFFFTAFVVISAIIFKGMKHLIREESLKWLNGSMAILIASGVGILTTVWSRIFLKKRLKKYFRSSLSEQLEKVERVFAPMVFITSCTVAFAHGANDVANAVGPLAAVIDILRNGNVQMKVPVPPWVLMIGGIGIVTGLAMYGYKVMTTVGKKITVITPSRGLAADIAGMTVVLLCSRLKLPVSTTHTLVGAIIGVAFARGVGAVNKRVTRNIFSSWLVTVPVAALLSIIIFLIGRLFLLGSIIDLIKSGSGG